MKHALRKPAITRLLVFIPFFFLHGNSSLSTSRAKTTIPSYILSICSICKTILEEDALAELITFLQVDFFSVFSAIIDLHHDMTLVRRTFTMSVVIIAIHDSYGICKTHVELKAEPTLRAQHQHPTRINLATNASVDDNRFTALQGDIFGQIEVKSCTVLRCTSRKFDLVVTAKTLIAVFRITTNFIPCMITDSLEVSNVHHKFTFPFFGKNNSETSLSVCEPLSRIIYPILRVFHPV
nr:MAG TPA: hypothetical protein [Caudoviricetes sp.]